MLGIGVGCVGLSLDDFCGLYFEEFEGIWKAWQQMNEGREREEWERTRILATICIQPHVKKKITPRQLIPLPWDSIRKGTPSGDPQLTKEQQKARFEKLAKRNS